jgi:hypothetical protein
LALLTTASLTDVACGERHEHESTPVAGFENRGLDVQGDVVRVAAECFRPYATLGLDDGVDRFTPAYENGRFTGLKALIRNDGILAGLGLQRGDVLTGISGIALNSPEGTLSVVERLRASPTEIVIELTRAGRQHRLRIAIEGSPSACEFFHSRKL